MLVLNKPIRLLAVTCLAFCLTASLGCQQMSSTVRKEKVRKGESVPTPPDFGAPTSIPESSTLPPLPLPAPASESALRETLSDELGWEFEEIEVVDRGDDQFFPVSTPRPQEQSQAQRRWERVPQLPVITPAGPELRHVSAQEPALLPVPR